MEKLILDHYKQFNYISASKLYKIIKPNHPEITLKKITDVIKDQPQYQLHKKQKDKVAGHIYSLFLNDVWNADLLDMSNYSHANHNYKWILLVVDIFSRKAYTVGLKTKTQESILEGFKTITNGKVYPKILITDSEPGFSSKLLSDWYSEHGIKHDTVEVGYHPALGVIDRLSRTLKEAIHKNMSEENDTIWYDRLSKITEAYNNTPHTALKIQNKVLTPNEVPQNEAAVLKLNLDKKGDSDSSGTSLYKEGDTVLKKLKKTIFNKGYKQTFGVTKYKIKSIKGVNAILEDGSTVKLNDLQVVKPDEIKDEIKEEPKKVEAVNAVVSADKQAKVQKEIKKELKKLEIEDKNVIKTEPRVRKAPKKYDDYEMK